MDNMLDKEVMKARMDEIKEKKFRQDVRLAENEQSSMSLEEQQYHTVESALSEEKFIDTILQKAGVEELSEEDRQDFLLRSRTNKNFLLVNLEKYGGDSEFMKNVKNSIKDLDAFLSKPVNYAIKRQEAIGTALEKINQAIRHCENYTDRGRPLLFWHRKRYDAVVATKVRLEDDRARLILAKGADATDDMYLENTDTLFDLMNRQKIEKRHGRVIDDEKERAGVMVRYHLHGVKSAEFEKLAFDRKVMETAQKTKLERTAALVTYAYADDKKLLDNAQECASFYNNLEGNMEGIPDQKQKQKRIEAIEKVFEMIMDYDFKNFDFNSYADAVSSEKFKKNLLMVNAAFDCDIYIKEYRNLVENGHEGLNLKYSADQLKEIEAKRDACGPINNYYKILTVYYSKPKFYSIDLSALMKMDVTTLEKEFVEKMSGKDDDLKELYSAVYNFRMLGYQNNLSAVMEYDVDKPADILLQEQRRVHLCTD